jgi:hypothetical protein
MSWRLTVGTGEKTEVLQISALSSQQHAPSDLILLFIVFVQYYHLQCDAVQPGRKLPTSLLCLPRASCWQAECHLISRWFAELFFGPEDGGDTFLRKVGYNSTYYTASYPRRWYSSVIMIFTRHSVVQDILQKVTDTRWISPFMELEGSTSCKQQPTIIPYP